MKRRVVVTGLGLITPLGYGVKPTWTRLIRGECAIESLLDKDEIDVEGLPCTVGACVPRPLPNTAALKATLRQSPFIQYASLAAEEALQDANLMNNMSEQQKLMTGVAIASGIGCIQDTVDAAYQLRDGGYRKLSPFFVPRTLINLAAGHVSIQHGFKGPNHAAATACTAGAHAIGDAMRFIQYGDADIMVAGGSEAALCRLALAGFSRAKALATKFNDRPLEASRPFDDQRDGFVMGEGAGAMILEEYEHAKHRGARIYAEIVGYGLSADAHHITSPPESAEGAILCMMRALKNSGLKPEDIGYINAHATSTPVGDAVELRAIQNVFGENKLKVSSTKGSVGHLLGAAGAVEAVFSVLALNAKIAPPTVNLVNSGQAKGLNLVPTKAQELKTDAVLTNSFGFGGTNASLIFKRV